MPTSLDKRERSRGYSIGYFDKRILFDLANLSDSIEFTLPVLNWQIDLTPEKNSLKNILLWDAVTLDLNAGRKRTRDVKLSVVAGPPPTLTKADLKDRSTFNFAVNYTLDIGKLVCRLAARHDRKYTDE